MMNIDSQLGDIHQLITVDGKTLTVPDGFEVVYRTYGGYGAPPVEWITRRGYKQHGVTKIDYLLSPRTVSVSFFRSKACDRETYWLNRRELHDFLRPNRGGDGLITFVINQAGGERRALKVNAQPGAVFPPSDSDNSWSIDEPIDFIAFDPIWFDPDAVSADVVFTVDSSLVFPITFPITFGVNGAQFNYLITYTGSWKSYPVLTLTGPYTSARITNSVTGVTIDMIQGISDGESRIIDLTPGQQSIKDGAGVNKFSDLAPGANLVEFAIEPDPIAPDGVQTVSAILQGAQIYTGSGWKVQNQIMHPTRWYRLSDTTPTLLDLGSDSAAGVATGGYTQGIAGAIPADPDTATSINGTTALLSIPTIPFQALSYTISIFASFTTLVGNPVVFGADVNPAALGGEIALGVTSAGGLIIYLGGGVTHTSAAGLIVTGQYYMLSMTYNKLTGALRGYINNVAVISVTGSDFTAASPACYLGSYGASNRTAGTVDEARVWLGTALTQADFNLLYASRLVASRTYTPSGFHVDYNTRYWAI